ncbi:hypothetical protein PISL3812_06218 [Talaromyces islandicus]|uniref:Oxidase ustYa n=1 Tax=Talaromyces islandicus TaxID=28573 RepID=A0A0U1M182_TALIS|nr:hypothetical protein PISL3812_06218 [Talaromyces islandicus]
MSFEQSKPDEPLMSGEGNFIEESKSESKKSTLMWSFAVVLTAFVFFRLGIAAGKYQPETERDGLLNPDGSVKVFMEYNSTFTQRPSPESNNAWDSLFPKGVGFIKHPTIAPETSGLVVFHALHCLNALRQVYYAAIDDTLPPDHEEHSHLTDPHHVRHCFDYLRQSLMCSADTNLETVDKELKGVTGWGFDRTCRDYESVKAWAEEHWANEI